ncbi:hypothetical protein ElyMa_006593300 [Elysia marginata]|uniref:Apple domain-containing protein n=1 Tax=Elysia marginata TaxID=1093978 RepID=A0AAV4IG37_9GAST|nr:hypothetical protein ElyMa_006593300 [Elysia marginata]
MKLTKTTSKECHTIPLGRSWSTGSPIECYLRCLSQFPDNCYSIVYNKNTQTCKPGDKLYPSSAELKGSILDPNSSDTIFYVHQPIPLCTLFHEQCGFFNCTTDIDK